MVRRADAQGSVRQHGGETVPACVGGPLPRPLPYEGRGVWEGHLRGQKMGRGRREEGGEVGAE